MEQAPAPARIITYMDAMNNWIDIALGLMLIVSVISGLKAGFVRTAIGFAAAIAGLLLALHNYRAVAVSLPFHTAHPRAANIAGFALIYFGISVLASVVTGMLSRFIHSLDLVWLDRGLGAGFGVVRGLLYGAVLIWAMMAFFPVQPKAALARSRLAPCVMSAAEKVADASPDEIKRTFRQSYRELNRALPENLKDKLPAAPSNEI